MVRRSRITLLAAGVALAALVSACGVPGTPRPGEPDVRTLEVGPYPVDRHSYDQDPHGKGAILEGIRMADAIAPVVRIDPALNVGVDAGVVVDSEQAVDGYLASVAKPVLERHGMVVGYRSMGADLPFVPFSTQPANPSPDTIVLQLLMRFPSAGVAAQAARDLEESDFQVAPDQNRRVRHPDYPNAMIHWRPGVANMGAFVAVGEFVLFVFVARPSADERDLLNWTGNTLRVAVPAAQAFTPTPIDRLNTLRVDPEGLLARVAVADRDRRLDPDRFSVHPPAALVHTDTNQSAVLRTIERDGIEAVAVIDNSWVMRVREESKASTLAADLVASAGVEFDPVAAPNDVPGATCQHLNRRGDTDKQYRYQCFVTYKRYVAVVASDSEPDVRQRVAAQYALLANSM
ncbi:DUF7373 family lipoprotein [Nocardia arizonensis]|uniref:DUF7373 family lipoprotein n=1 Tax=Nocardia arizonensis TaxID=1141647 RepID=UPI0006CF75BA|nr:hypothetical protein [Nocardia arizonensis]